MSQPPHYHINKCCKTCQHEGLSLDTNGNDVEFCQKYMIDVDEIGVCDEYE